MNTGQKSEGSDWVALIKPVADDEWIVAHRGSEWLGLAPDLEEDLAYSSINQDEMGHAHFYYALLAELGDPEPERTVYGRPPEQWRNARILEAPNGDWAQTVALRYFYEVFDDLRLEGLSHSLWQPLQDGIRTIRREESYHLQHFSTWFDMLAVGTPESRRRLVNGIDALWMNLGDLFSWGQPDTWLAAMGLDNLSQPVIKAAWERRVGDKLEAAGIPWPGPVPEPLADGRRGQHTQDLQALLNVMTEVQRTDLTAQW